VLFGATSGDVSESSVPVTNQAGLLDETTGNPPRSLTMLIGPEGGWSATERSLMSEKGARAVSLGPHVLRTETAAVTGLTVLQTLREKWSADGQG
jgi:RsmE family RNA methyltransferase